jgi:hypothetical protein
VGGAACPAFRLALHNFSSFHSLSSAKFKPMISVNVFKDYVNQSRPIRIHLADGREIVVPHGEHLSLQPGGTDVFNLVYAGRIRSVI